MQLEELSLQNFISHKSTEIKFQPGVNMIIGPNASGKTSILESISYSLVKAYKKGNADDLIKNGTNELKVSLDFYANGKKWRVSRNRKRMGSPESVLKEKEGDKFHVATRGERAVTKEVQDIIALDKSLFLNSVYVRQGELLDLIEATASERKKIIGKLIGINEIEKAWGDMREVIRHFERKKERIEIELKEKETPQKLKEKRKKLEKLREEIHKSEEEVKQLREEVNQLNEEVKNLEVKKEEYHKLEQKIESLSNEASKKNKKIDEIEATPQKIDEIQEEIEEAALSKEEKEKRVEDLTEELAASREVRDKKEDLKIKYHRKRLKELRKEINSLEDEFHGRLEQIADTVSIPPSKVSLGNVKQKIRQEKAEIKKEFEDLRQQLSDLEHKKGESQGELKQQKELKASTKRAKGKCPVCGSDLTPAHKEQLLEEFKESIKHLREEIKAYERKLKEKRHKLEEVKKTKEKLQDVSIDILERQSEELDQKKEKKSNHKEKARQARRKLKKFASKRKIKPTVLENLKSRIEKMEEQKETLLKEEKEVDEKISSLERKKVKTKQELKKKKELKRELGRLKESIEKLKQERKSHEFDPETYKKVKEKAKEKEKALSNLEGVLKEKRKKKEKVKEKISQLEEELEEFREKQDLLNHLEEDYIPFLKKVRGVYHKDKLQKDLREYYRPRIEKEMKKIVSNFNLGFTDVELEEDWNITAYGPRGEKNIDMISGGEEVGLSIALRLAIARVLTGKRLKLLMLDEPTIYLDDDRIDGLVEILRRLESIPQVIVVSHNKKLIECADTLFRVKKEANTSKVTKAQV